MRISVLLLVLIVVSSCVLPFKIKLKGQCDANLGVEQANSTCRIKRPVYMEADYESR